MKPLIIAHRGNSCAAPENTRAALLRSITSGADYAECDVRLTSDGVPVLIHDEDLFRTGRIDLKISSATLAEVADVDVGSWFSPEFADERLITLERAIALLPPDFGLVVEIKDEQMEAPVLEAVRRTEAVSRAPVIFFSFSAQTLMNIGDTPESFPRIWLCDVARLSLDEALQRIAYASDIGVDGVGLSYQGLCRTIVRVARERGLRVFCWTVNDASEIRAAFEMEVDGVITDFPNRASQILNGMPGECSL